MIAIVALVGLVGSVGLAKDVANSQTRAQELGNLQEAYNLLKIADKDYHGHRVKAMRAIESAAKEAGGPAEGKHRGREAQTTSDEQLRQAATILESVSSTASNMGQERLSKHVEKALSEIHTALDIK
jgi:hypothetical protein